MRSLKRITFTRTGQIIFTFKEIVKLVYKTKPRYLVSVFSINIFSGLLVIPTLYIQKLIIDTLIKGVTAEPFEAVLRVLTFYIFISVVLGFLQILINRARSFMQGILTRSFYAELEILKSRKLASLDLMTIESSSFEDRYTKIDQESGRAYSLIAPIADIPGNVVSLVSAVAILVSLSPLAAVAIILSTFPRVFINSRLIKGRYDLSTEISPLQKVQGWLNYYLLRNRNYMELKILNLVPFLSAKYETTSHKILDKRSDFDWEWERSTIVSFVPLTLADGAITVWMAYLVLLKTITVGSFQFYFSALKRVQSEFQSFTSSLVDMYENYLYVNELVWFLNLEPKIGNHGGVVLSDAEPLHIEFKNVWFKYKKKQKWTLKNMNLTLSEGEHIAIVGVNGAGKSTLLKLLARFYDPQKGEILVNKIPLKTLDVDKWRDRLAILFQEFESYPFSAHESIGYGNIDDIENLSEIKDAAKRTDIDTFIESLPEKYENPLDPHFKGGVRPSSGQWQRIGIARMLFRKNAKTIVMDEPTSSVDPEAEEQIFNELDKIAKNKILIFVTQRFSTVRIADKIILLGKGTVLEMGSHDQLMKLKGKYRELFMLQAKGYQ